MKRGRIFARYPIPKSKLELKEVLEKCAKTLDKTYIAVLEEYIKSRIDDIAKSNEKILREKQRIKKANKCIRLAFSLIRDRLTDEQDRLFYKNYFKSILNHKISIVKDKIRNE